MSSKQFVPFEAEHFRSVCLVDDGPKATSVHSKTELNTGGEGLSIGSSGCSQHKRASGVW
jgi:hypothetical protein